MVDLHDDLDALRNEGVADLGLGTEERQIEFLRNGTIGLDSPRPQIAPKRHTGTVRRRKRNSGGSDNHIGLHVEAVECQRLGRRAHQQQPRAVRHFDYLVGLSAAGVAVVEVHGERDRGRIGPHLVCLEDLQRKRVGSRRGDIDAVGSAGQVDWWLVVGDWWLVIGGWWWVGLRLLLAQSVIGWWWLERRFKNG